MARTLYAGRPGDTVVSLFELGGTQGRQLLSVPVTADGSPTVTVLTVWTAPGGTQLTDLLAADGITPITGVMIPAGDIQIPGFYGPDGVDDDLYLRDPEGDYTRLDVGRQGPEGDVTPEAIAARDAAIAAKTAAETAETNAETAATTATTKAGEAESSASSAQTNREAAEAARDAAQGHASTATTKAGEAAESAGISQAAATTATDNANGFDIGEVTTGAPGSSASATITGTAPNRELNLTIPTGETGPSGPDRLLVWSGSAYPARPDGDPVIFSGPTDPGVLMTVGDVWIDTDDTAAGTTQDLVGTGSPLGVIAAPVGSVYRDLAGTLGAWVWRKRSGTGTSGWVCVEGRTGARNISSLLISANGWTDVGAANLRRDGDIVTVGAAANRGGAASTLPLFVLPVGFRPKFSAGYSTQSGITYVAADGTVSPVSATATPRGVLSFLTDDPWPTTSLPGTGV